jgi:hypothetical protein
MEYILRMEWDVQLDEDFAAWLDGLPDELRTEILAHAALLGARGPHLGRPYVDTLKGSAYTNMKELRVQFRGDPWRILFAFDPGRSAILLVGATSEATSVGTRGICGSPKGASNVT